MQRNIQIRLSDSPLITVRATDLLGIPIPHWELPQMADVGLLSAHLYSGIEICIQLQLFDCKYFAVFLIQYLTRRDGPLKYCSFSIDVRTPNTVQHSTTRALRVIEYLPT